MSLHAAIDLGAESGRVILGELTEGPAPTVALREIHRFPNGPVRVGDTYQWDILRLWSEIKTGLARLAREDTPPETLSADTWGVDYAWIRGDLPFLASPRSYRDPRTEGPFRELRSRLGDPRIYGQTGIQFMVFNTLYQLAADQRDHPELPRLADHLLLLADAFNFLLCGVPAAEVSLASTTQLYDPRARAWSPDLLAVLGLPETLLPRIVPSGTVLGPLLPAIVEETGLPASTRVVATCSHDTGAAVAAVPAEGRGWAYLSSGTWSLIGLELPEPNLSPAALDAGFTNEIGHGHSVRFLKNIVGLWILQECRRQWAKDGNDLDYASLTAQAAASEPFRSLIHPNDARFFTPGAMPEKIRSYCEETAQPVPQNPGQTARAILESLALLYADTLEILEKFSDHPIDRIHVVGGGSQSRLLNQFTANATGRLVLSGPVEATALGNILLQSVGTGRLQSLADLRSVVRRSFQPEEFTPQHTSDWQAIRSRFAALPVSV